ncbi:cyclic nucleotide-gated ion channel 17-like [Typha latifolia]|uniref:cyclic nucleotide-gated ion channel 17-like n=1 Tax=Typha latifolia TaxID=4733 RepID=UPI003C2F7844
MFASKVQDGVEMQRRTARIFPDDRQGQAKRGYQDTRADRLGVNRADERNLGNPKVLDEGQEQWNRFVLDPASSIILTWNRVYLISCLFALFIDPFYYYLPLVRVDSASSCVRMDRRLSITVTVLRSLADLFYLLNIVIKFFTAYVAPSTRMLGKGELVTDPKEIRRRYIKSELFIDVAAALPLPQIAFWLVVPSISSSNYNVKNTTFALVILIQYIIRMYLIVPLSNQIIKAAGVVAKTAWGGAAYNLLLYMLASHITGAVYYLLSVERQITCWNMECVRENDSPNTPCDLRFLNCDFTGYTDFQNWTARTNVFSNCNARNYSISFNYGIFNSSLSNGALSTLFHEKYFYCLWWGLQQLSSSGNPLVTSTFMVENIFAIAIGAVSLILFAQLIGKMQTYLQSISKRLEEWRLRERDTEEWMRHHQLPDHLQERVRRFVQVKWLATRGVDEETILQTLPADIRRDVQRHLCLDLVRRVPFFSEMDNQLLDAICDRLVSSLCTENSYIAREGDPVNEMLFIIRGKLESCTTNGGRTNFFNSIILRPGDFCGEELLTWALLPKTVVNLPTSTRTVRALTEVEAFALRAEDLKFVANQFRRLHSRKLQHTFRFYSHHWRTWGACFIQTAWRQYQKRKMSDSLSRCESYLQWSDEEVAHKPSQENAGASSSSIIDGSIVPMPNIGSVSRRFLTSDTNIARLQKPDEPDFSEDHFD